jgi:hypothetical protein
MKMFNLVLKCLSLSRTFVKSLLIDIKVTGRFMNKKVSQVRSLNVLLRMDGRAELIHEDVVMLNARVLSIWLRVGLRNESIFTTFLLSFGGKSPYPPIYCLSIQIGIN